MSFLDTPLDHEFPLYTRAGAHELLPRPIGPLAWSVIGPVLEEGHRIALCDDLGLFARPGLDRPYWAVGRIDARLHRNLAVWRRAAARLPGLSAGALDAQLFGEGRTDLPDDARHPDDGRFRRRSPATVGRTLAGMSRRVDRDRAAAQAWGEVLAPVLADGSDTDLVHHLRLTMARTAPVVGTHLTAHSLLSSLVDRAMAALRRAGIDGADALGLLSGAPGLVTVLPARRVTEIASAVTAGSALDRALRRGAMDELRSPEVPGGAQVAERLDAFVDEFGHLGDGEFDPTGPAWADHPSEVAKLVSTLAGVTPPPDDDAAEPAGAGAAIDPGRIARPLLGAARSAMVRAARTHNNAARATHQLRQLVATLQHRVADRIDPASFGMHTLDEIEAVVRGGASPMTSELRRRADEFTAASSRPDTEWYPPPVTDRLEPGAGGPTDRDRDVRNGEGPSAPAPDAAATDHGAGLPAPPPAPQPTTHLDGIPASPGVTAGRARILATPSSDIDAGDIVVTVRATTAYTPLLVRAGALVTDVGGLLSPAATFARELGIPAVVNTRSATGAIHTGDRVEVDGTTGRVTVTGRGSGSGGG